MPDEPGLKLLTTVPVWGLLLYFTPPSVQLEVTGAMSMEPGERIRLTNSVTEAWPTWLAVMFAGRPERSNWMYAVLPLPTYKLDK